MVIIDGDSDELEEDKLETTAIENAKKLEVRNRILVSPGNKTLEIDLFPDIETNSDYLKDCFMNLGHKKSFENLINKTKSSPKLWESELIKRIDKTIKKGRFAQELSLLIDDKFIVPRYISDAIMHILKCKKITFLNA